MAFCSADLEVEINLAFIATNKATDTSVRQRASKLHREPELQSCALIYHESLKLHIYSSEVFT